MNALLRRAEQPLLALLTLVLAPLLAMCGGHETSASRQEPDEAVTLEAASPSPEPTVDRALMLAVLRARQLEGDASYDAIVEGDAVRLLNAATGLEARVATDGAAIARNGADETLVALRFAAIERRAQGLPPLAAHPFPCTGGARAVHATQRGAELDHGPRLRESWSNGPVGLEQSFIVAERPEGRGALQLAIEVAGLELLQDGGDAVRMLDAEGRDVLLYTGLYAEDASGTLLPSEMRVAEGHIVLAIEDADASYPLLIDPWIQEQKLTPTDGAVGDYFGISVSLSGDGSRALVGAYADDVTFSNQGSAYVFVRSGSTWAEEQKLTASDGALNDSFGYSVSLSGDGSRALVGAQYDDVTFSNQGSAYVFVRSGSTWAEEQKLTASDGALNDSFGYSVSLSGDGSRALVGAYVDDVTFTDQGSAYVFVRSGSTWVEEQKLIASDGAADNWFGWSVSLSGDGSRALVGAVYDDGTFSAQGSAYVFVRSGSSWAQEQRLTASDGAADDYFGHAVSLSGDGSRALVGALDDDVAFNAQGSAYVFVRSGSSWAQEQKLTASDGAPGDWFGSSVSLSGDGSRALVGAYRDDITFIDQGSAYVFVRSGSTWAQEQKLPASDGAADDNFGSSASLSGDGSRALVGAQRDDASQGSAYVFRLELASGQPCGAPSQCGSNNCVDGVCCGSPSCPTCQACNVAGNLGTCANVTAGTSCDDALFCTGTDSCDDAGACILHTGDPCPGADGDADCAESCDEASDVCTASDANGSTCDDAVECNGDDTCQSGACDMHQMACGGTGGEGGSGGDGAAGAGPGTEETGGCGCRLASHNSDDPVWLLAVALSLAGIQRRRGRSRTELTASSPR